MIDIPIEYPVYGEADCGRMRCTLLGKKVDRARK